MRLLAQPEGLLQWLRSGGGEERLLRHGQRAIPALERARAHERVDVRQRGPPVKGRGAQQMLVVDPTLRCGLCRHEVHALKVRVLQLVRQVRWRQHERVVHVVGQHVQPVGPEAELGRVGRLQRAEKVGGTVCHRPLHRQPPHSHLQQHQ